MATVRQSLTRRGARLQGVLTVTGTSDDIVVPSQSWPYSLSPRQTAVPPSKTPGKSAHPAAPGLTSTPMESRLVDLEVRYTHLERQLGELSDIVFAQQKTIDGLLRQLAATKAQLTQLAPPITNEPPPHY